MACLARPFQSKRQTPDSRFGANTSPSPTLLVLEDGRSLFRGPFGAEGEAFGELIFSTGMPDYQKALTSPSYRGQAVLATAPHIGNTGWNDEGDESARTQVAGYMVRDPVPRPSNRYSRRSLDTELMNQGIIGVYNIDIRALTRHTRSLGAMRVGISTCELNPDRLRAKALEQPAMMSADLCGEVSAPEARIVPTVGERRFTVTTMDLDIKSTIPAQMADRDMEVHVLPVSTSFKEIAMLEPDGIFFSNDPGDPVTADGPMTVPRQVFAAGIPHFGICFGNRLFGHALGFGTYKLKFGHRGINQPMLDRTTRKVETTLQNHGFAIDTPPSRMVDIEFGQANISHTDLNDDIVEGLKLRRNGKLVAFSVQYHPEAAAEPYGTNHLFDRFTGLMRNGGTR